MQQTLHATNDRQNHASTIQKGESACRQPTAAGYNSRTSSSNRVVTPIHTPYIRLGASEKIAPRRAAVSTRARALHGPALSTTTTPALSVESSSSLLCSSRPAAQGEPVALRALQYDTAPEIVLSSPPREGREPRQGGPGLRLDEEVACRIRRRHRRGRLSQA